MKEHELFHCQSSLYEILFNHKTSLEESWALTVSFVIFPETMFLYLPLNFKEIFFPLLPNSQYHGKHLLTA